MRVGKFTDLEGLTTEALREAHEFHVQLASAMSERGERNGAFTPGYTGEAERPTVEANNREAYREGLMSELETLERIGRELARREGPWQLCEAHMPAGALEGQGLTLTVKAKCYRCRQGGALAAVRSAAEALEAARNDRTNAILRAQGEGHSLRDIANAAGLSHTQVRRILADAEGA